MASLAGVNDLSSRKGVFCPAKVVRTALQDAASVAGLLITTEAAVVEAPKKNSPMPAMPGVSIFIDGPHFHRTVPPGSVAEFSASPKPLRLVRLP